MKFEDTMGFDWIHEETTAMQDKKLTIKVRQRKPEFDVEHPGMGLEDLGPGEVIFPARRTVDENTVLEYKTGCLTDFYTMGKELGRGHFGVVRMCERKGTGVQVACKSIDKAHLKVNFLQALSGSGRLFISAIWIRL